MSVDDLTNAIEESVTAPQSVSVDGQTVTERPLSDQIAAAKFVAGQHAMKQPAGKPRLPFQAFKISPPGAT